MRIRPVLSLVATAVLVTAVAGGVTAQAAAPTKAKPKPKPSCNLVTDPTGDETGLLSSSPGLDIVSADVASNASSFTAVLRLAGAPVKPGNTAAPEGASYYAVFTVPGAANPVYLTAAIGLTGTTYAFGDVEPQGTEKVYRDKTGVVTGSIAGSVISLTAPTSLIGTLGTVTPGVTLSGLGADVFYPVEVPDVGGLLEQADTASSAKTYLTGSPSCVKP